MADFNHELAISAPGKEVKRGQNTFLSLLNPALAGTVIELVVAVLETCEMGVVGSPGEPGHL